MKLEREEPVNIKDIAREAGVAISTVSHTIHGTKFVSPDLKKRIQKTITKLDYEVNPLASSLKSRSTKTIGVLVTNINRIFFPQFIKGIQTYCSKLGYNLTLCDTDDQFEKEKYFMRMLKNQWVDGIILDSVADESKTQYLDAICQMGDKRKKIPVVSFERELKGYPISSVTVDNYKGACLATKHLLDLGCRKISHITGPMYACMSKSRAQGYIDSLKEEKLTPIIAEGGWSPLSGYHATKSLLRNYEQIDGIFAANDEMAVGTLKALKEHGLKVPEDVKVVGFDNTFVASIVSPSLTTINVPKFEIGISIAKLLIKNINNPDEKPKNINLPINLIVRQSTALKGIDEWELFGW